MNHGTGIVLPGCRLPSRAEAEWTFADSAPAPVVFGRLVFLQAEPLRQGTVAVARGAVQRGQRMVAAGMRSARALGVDAEALHTARGSRRLLEGADRGRPVVLLDVVDHATDAPATDPLQAARCSWTRPGLHRFLAVRNDPRDPALLPPGWASAAGEHPYPFLFDGPKDLGDLCLQVSDLVAHFGPEMAGMPAWLARRIVIPLHPT